MTWVEAADLLEDFLERAAQLVDGEDVPGEWDLPEVELEGTPDPDTVERIRVLLVDVEEAVGALALRRAEIQQELDHTDRLRSAGAGYLRYQ